MNFRKYLPVILIILTLSVMVGAQEFLRQAEPDSPDQLRSQVGNVGNSLDNIRKWDLEIELFDDAEIDFLYESHNQDSPRASVIREDRPENQRITGEEAVAEIEMLVNALPTLPTNEPLTLIEAILEQLEISQSDINEFELEYRLADGTVYDIELEVDDDDADD